MTTATSSPITVAHATVLLDAPQFGARALAFLDVGEVVQCSVATDGFLRVRRDNGEAGYVLAALCAPHARSEPTRTHVVQPVLLYGHPTPGTQLSAPWIVSPNELLTVLDYNSQFVNIQRPNGQTGYVPALMLTPGLLVAGQTTHTQQAVHLYHSPALGDQFAAEGMVTPEEALLLLGNDGRFALIQRDDGQLGFIPAILCGMPSANKLLNLGPVDLGWMALGGGWCWINWLGITGGLGGLSLIDMVFKPYIGLLIVLNAAAALWFSPRQRMARSFALGLLCGYALLHLISNGTLTMWR